MSLRADRGHASPHIQPQLARRQGQGPETFVTLTSTTLPMRSRAQPRRCNLSPSALCLRHATGLSRSIPQQHWPQSCVPSPACQPPPKASATRCAGHGPATWPLLALCVMGTKRPSHQARLHRPNETLHPRLVRCQRLHVAAQLVHLPAVPASASHVAAPLLPGRRSRLPKQTKRRRPCRASRKTAQGLVEECVADAPCGWPPPWQSGAPRCCAGACPPPPQVAPAAASTQSRPTPQHPSHTSTPAPSQAPCPCVAACAGRASRQPASRGAARHACEIPGWLQLPPSAPPPASSPLPAPPAPVADSRPASPGVSAGRCRQARMRDRHSDARAPLVEPRHAPHAAPLSWTCPPPPRSSAAPAAPPHATASPPSVTMDSESSKRKGVHISSGTGCNALPSVSQRHATRRQAVQATGSIRTRQTRYAD